MRPNWFVGLPVKIPQLSQMLKHLPDTCRGFHPEDVHMTIAFLGAMAPQKVSQIQSLMAEMKGQPLTISLGRGRALPTPQRLSAFSLELSMGHDQVCQWMTRWRAPLQKAAGVRLDTRDPLPHITLARPIRQAGEHGIRQGLAWLETLEIPKVELSVDRLALYTWAEHRHQRLFKIVFEEQW